MRNHVQILLQKTIGWVALAPVLLSFSMGAMTVDQRFFVPFLERNPLIGERKSCAINLQPYVLLADKSFNEYGEECELFSYDGDAYGLRYLDDAIVASGRRNTSLIKSEWQSKLLDGPYVTRGRMVGKGIAATMYFSPRNCFGFGGRIGAMEIDSELELIRDTGSFDAVVNGFGDEQELTSLQGSLHQALDLEPACWQGTGMTDAEVFARVYFDRDYFLWCRYVSLGAELGAVLPTGRTRDIENPASLPFGSPGFGWYVEGSLDVLLKKDIWFFLIGRIQKRIATPELSERMSIGREPWRFGSLVGNLWIDPGFTFALSPYVVFEGMRDGLGFRVGYTLVWHAKDRVRPAGFEPVVPNKKPELGRYQDASEWGSERVHAGILYDFSRGKKVRGWEPVIAATVDVPTAWFVGKRSFKTFGISIGLETSF